MLGIGGAHEKRDGCVSNRLGRDSALGRRPLRPWQYPAKHFHSSLYGRRLCLGSAHGWHRCHHSSLSLGAQSIQGGTAPYGKATSNGNSKCLTSASTGRGTSSDKVDTPGQ